MPPSPGRVNRCWRGDRGDDDSRAGRARTGSRPGKTGLGRHSRSGGAGEDPVPGRFTVDRGDVLGRTRGREPLCGAPGQRGRDRRLRGAGRHRDRGRNPHDRGAARPPANGCGTRAFATVDPRCGTSPDAARGTHRQRAGHRAVRLGGLYPAGDQAPLLPAQRRRRLHHGATTMTALLGPGAVVLGIESSCDETGAGLVRLTEGAPELLGHALASSQDEHARFGGVVPEIASRAHLEAMTPTIRAAFASAGLGYRDVDAVAVTSGPGLAGALLVGVAAAKAYAAAWDVPLFGVNHLAGHVAADTLVHGPLPGTTLALLVSGGHTQLLRVDDLAGDITEVGS